MPIHSGSRYEDSTVDYFRKTEYGQSYPITLYAFDDLQNIKYVTHRYTKGETLQGIALQYFHSAALWWTIAEYNPELTDFLHIADGTVLRIPHV